MTMQIMQARARVVAAAAVVVLGLSLVLSGCGRHTTNDGTNAGSQPSTTTTSQTGGTSGVSLTDLQNLGSSVAGDLSSLSTDDAAANADQSNQDQEVQP